MTGAYEVEAARVALCHAPMAGLIGQVSADTGVPVSDILSADRTQPIAHARQLCMWLGRDAGISISQIGRALGRDRKTVLHGIRAVENRMKEQAT